MGGAGCAGLRGEHMAKSVPADFGALGETFLAPNASGILVRRRPFLWAGFGV
jgi:hypothetical protein